MTKIGLLYFIPGKSEIYIGFFSIFNKDDCDNHRYFWETCDLSWVIIQHYSEFPGIICEYHSHPY